MTEKRISFAMILVTIIFALFGGILGGIVTVNYLEKNQAAVVISEKKSAQEKQVVITEDSAVINTVKKVSPSVVSIVISKDLPLYRQRVLDFNDFFDNDSFFNFGVPFAVPEADRDENGQIRTQRQKVGGGSGFIVSEDGLIVTNRHVVADSEAEYTVILNDQTEYSAKILSRDTINDVAILKIKPKGKLSAAKLGNSDKLQVGQYVIAIGNALAEYENTVTTGVVSAKGRSLAAGTIQFTENLINLIQTDAAINPGNSGGPLVSLAGEVIGINTAIAAQAQGIGFAIPINDVKNVIDSVKAHGKIVRPFLGVRFMTLNADKAKELKIDVDNGALLTGDEAKGEFAVVPGSPAEKSGLKIKDVILEVDGEKVTLEKPLHVLIAQKQPGDTVALKVWRSGEITEIKVKLEEAK